MSAYTHVGIDVPEPGCGNPLPGIWNGERMTAVKQLLQDIGFEAITFRPAMLASSISESLLLALPEAIRYRLLGSRFARLLYLSMIFPASISYLLGNAGAIEITAQKRWKSNDR